MSSLLDIFGAREGIVCAVGAGGKKSTLFRLLREHPGRAAMTATAYTTFFPPDLGARELLAESARLEAAVPALAGRVVYARPGDKPDRLRGVPPDLVARIHRAGNFEATFVKADGARMRWIKAPREDEPVIPAGATTVLMLASARALGEPLGERVAHRPECIHRLCGTRDGDTFTPAHLARLFSHPEGLLKGSDGARVIAVINMVDDARRQALAAEAAGMALGACARLERVVLACMKREDQPVVEVLTR